MVVSRRQSRGGEYWQGGPIRAAPYFVPKGANSAPGVPQCSFGLGLLGEMLSAVPTSLSAFLPKWLVCNYYLRVWRFR